MPSVPEHPRDRDATGRARNARPRDAFGRPLPHGSIGVPPIPDDLSLTGEQTLDLAQDLLDAGRAFQAHEVLESRWKAVEEAQREVWRGLAQLAVGITHVQRGNRAGAVTLLRRAADRLGEHTVEPPHGVDATGLATWARRLAARLEQDGPDGVRPVELAPRLRDGPQRR